MMSCIRSKNGHFGILKFSLTANKIGMRKYFPTKFFFTLIWWIIPRLRSAISWLRCPISLWQNSRSWVNFSTLYFVFSRVNSWSLDLIIVSRRVFDSSNGLIFDLNSKKQPHRGHRVEEKNGNDYLLDLSFVFVTHCLKKEKSILNCNWQLNIYSFVGRSINHTKINRLTFVVVVS